MKITHVRVVPVKVPAAEPAFKWRDGLPGSSGPYEGAVLRISTDVGAEGVAVFARPGAATMLQDLVDRLLRAELVGQDPLRREYLWHRLWELDRIDEIPLPALGLVDTALWDLAARLQGLPLWEVLGGFRDKIPAYASTSTFANIPEFLDVATQCLELGYQGIKLHAWGDARRDAKLSQALREHVGGDVPLMYDGSAGFDLPDATYLGHALADAGYLWYEEPMREFSITAYRRLAETVRVPLLVAETSDGAHMNSADFIAAGAATFGVRISTNLRGGVTGAMRTAHLADSFRLRAEPHGSDLPTHHLCMAVPNATYFESLVTSTAVVRDPHIDANGMLHAPTSPGISLPAFIDYPAELSEFVEELPVFP
ncbi:enolase C-terminal domain-like protein [Arthrobacter sp. HY1533]|uniref:enolase C-terminal domain-like protein n=1 Tax=Arthrobacter sp. HY1533 TaxID=2970919 RepID=UPI0022B9E752|nr:enolase C-terminal domain-like protein [Arthrobacter sp. HY1533]